MSLNCSGRSFSVSASSPAVWWSAVSVCTFDGRVSRALATPSTAGMPSSREARLCARVSRVPNSRFTSGSSPSPMTPV